MRLTVIAVAGFAAFANAAMAQQTADQMDCAQAQAYFAANGVIYKRVHGNVLPITRGVPIKRSGALICSGRYSFQMTYGLATRDRRNCVISTYCTGDYYILRQ